MKKIENQKLSGERALFKTHDAHITNTTFFDGESPLKESSNLQIENCSFEWKYPLWYCNNVVFKDSIVTPTGRAGIWYTNDLKVINVQYDAVKGFRRCNNLYIENVKFINAEETLWSCTNVTLKNVEANGPYLGMNCQNVKLENFILNGDYGFDGCKNIEAHNCRFITKDAFWNCENVIVYDSYIEGEYFAWNSKDVTLVRCTISSLQGFCYMENVVLKDCKIIDTTLSFEYSTVDATVLTKIDSIKNPKSGIIKCKGVDEIILDDPDIDHSKTEIIVEE